MQRELHRLLSGWSRVRVPPLGSPGVAQWPERLVVFAPVAVITHSKIGAGCRVWLLWHHSGVRERQPARGLPRTRATLTLAGLSSRLTAAADAAGTTWFHGFESHTGSLRRVGAASRGCSCFRTLAAAAATPA